MIPRLSEKELRITVNEKLVDEATKILTEKKTMGDRLQKLDASRQGVSAAVYERVRNDYLKKLNELKGHLEELKKGLDQELVALTEKKIQIEANLKLHVEEIEEAKLRHALGEIPSEEYEKVAKEKTDEINRLEQALKEIQRTMERFEGFLNIPEPKAPLPRPAEASSSVSMEHKSSPTITEKKSAISESTAKVPLEEKKAAADLPADRQACLVMMENGKTGEKFEIDHNLSIGRSPSNDIVLKEPKVSRQHAQVQINGGNFLLVDLNSSNGTYVGGNKITEHSLKPNDEIRIGKTTLLFKV